MAQKIIVLVTKTKSFDEFIPWDDYKIFLACNPDRTLSYFDVEDISGSKLHWEFPNNIGDDRDFCREFNSVRSALICGYKLLAPPICNKNILGRDTYEWWLTKD